MPVPTLSWQKQMAALSILGCPSCLHPRKRPWQQQPRGSLQEVSPPRSVPRGQGSAFLCTPQNGTTVEFGKGLQSEFISTGHPVGDGRLESEEQPSDGPQPHLCTAVVGPQARLPDPLWGPGPTRLSLLPRKVCHHADCQQLHRRGPLNLCEACDSKFHSAMHYDGHVRFDLPPQGERG